MRWMNSPTNPRTSTNSLSDATCRPPRRSVFPAQSTRWKGYAAAVSIIQPKHWAPTAGYITPSARGLTASAGTKRSAAVRQGENTGRSRCVRPPSFPDIIHAKLPIYFPQSSAAVVPTISSNNDFQIPDFSLLLFDDSFVPQVPTSGDELPIPPNVSSRIWISVSYVAGERPLTSLNLPA